MKNLLKESLLMLYADSPSILHLLNQIEYDTLSVQYQKELDARISREDFKEVEDFLASEKYVCYVNAVNGASMAMTRDLLELMKFVTSENEGEMN